MRLSESQTLSVPNAMHWEKDNTHLWLDPEGPHWIAVDSPGAQVLRGYQDGLTLGEVLVRYRSRHGVESAKAWLHVSDFTQALIRSGFASLAPRPAVPYSGRASYARPSGLKELWFHTNNICNLACTHCLVNSAPWVQDWGLPSDRFLRLVDEAVALGVERFYFTGGEPFMRKDLAPLIRYVTETKGAELVILTNATLFKGERAEVLQTLSRERVRFQVSVDGASPSTHDLIRGPGAFAAAVEGLRLLAGLGFQTSVTTAVTAANVEELPAITEVAQGTGVRTQHLMWLHRRGRVVETAPVFPPVERLLEAVRAVRRAADRVGVSLDNWESLKQRVNGRPGVKYDLGNACWDSLCVYSDGTVYPSAALANIRPLALGSVRDGASLQAVWEGSPVAEAFRQATVAQKTHLAADPFRYLTGGGDLEHSFSFGVNGETAAAALAPARITEFLHGPDPYYPLYTALMQEAMWEFADTGRRAVNRRSGYDAPRILHAMGDGAIHCATDDLAVDGEVDVRTLHSNCVLAFDVDKPRRIVREFYGKAAEVPQAALCCPTTFDDSAIAHIPKAVIERFYGCGSPVTRAALRPGDTMVDLGSGAGIDCFIAAKLVGPTGRVIGVDMTDQMLAVAEQHRPAVAANLGYDVVEFRRGFLEQVPVETKTVDLVTSNCVINLSPDKPKVFAEIWRILKDHGRVVIADIVSDRPVPASLKVNPQLWGECLVGALTEEEFLARLQEAGFYGLSVLKKTYWKTIEGYDFFSVTVQGYKFEKTAGCRFIGQRAVYLGPMKSVMDEEGHLFPRNEAVEVCTDTAAKLSKPPYAGSFAVLEPAAKPPSPSTLSPREREGVRGSAACGPGCC